jgi:hypothetical protein
MYELRILSKIELTHHEQHAQYQGHSLSRSGRTRLNCRKNQLNRVEDPSISNHSDQLHLDHPSCGADRRWAYHG